MAIQQIPNAFASRAALLVALLVYLSFSDSSTHDEPKHFAAGLYDWNFRRHDLFYVNTPLVRMLASLPARHRFEVSDFPGFLRDETSTMWDGGTGDILWSRDGARAEFWLALGRCLLIPFALLGLCCTERFASKLYGDRAGPLAGWLYLLCPNLLAAGHSIAADGACAASVVAACYCFHLWLEGPTFGRCVRSGLSLGLAMSTKTMGVMLVPVFSLIWLIDRLRLRSVTRRRNPHPLQFLCIFYLALVCLNSLYGWEGTFVPLGDYAFVSRTLAGPEAIQVRRAPDVPERLRPAGNRFRGSAFGAIPVPLPALYVYGIDRQKSDFETSEFPVFMHGEWRRGRWDDPLRIASIKLPVGTLGLAALALTQVGFWPRRADKRSTSSTLWATLILILALNLAQTKMTIFFRYMVPCLPLLFVLISGILARDATGNRPRPGLRKAAYSLLAITALETALAFPYVSAFCNATVGRTWRGQQSFQGVNEYGQNLWRLTAWLDRLPRADDVFLTGAYRLKVRDVTGRDFEALPSLDDLQSLARRRPAVPVIRAGWYVSTEYDRNPPSEGEGVGYLRPLVPVATIAPGLAVHRLSEQDAALIEQRIRLNSDPAVK
jgi:hypothetical protein